LFDIRASPGKNRLYFAMSGRMTDDEIREASDRAIAEMERLRPGFDFVSDIAGLEPLSPVGIEETRRLGRYLIERRSSRLIRVVAGPQAPRCSCRR
jgi:hypothetical protein